MIHAVLFDMDGTITDTERIYNVMWTESAHELGYTFFTKEDALLLRSLNHKDSDALLKERFDGRIDYHALHILTGQKVDDYVKEHGVPLKPGVHETLAFLKEKGIKSAVVTATAMERALKRLDGVGLRDSFDDIISAHQVKEGKPHPDPYLFACKKLGEAPGDCIAVEDSPNGAYSAVRAGCKTIMVPDLTEPDDTLRAQLFAVCPLLSGICDYC